MKLTLIAILVALSAPAAAGELQPTIGACAGAFAKLNTADSLRAQMQLSLLGFAKFSSMPEAERAAYEAQVKADRERAMHEDTSTIMDACRAAAQPLPLPMLLAGPRP